MSVFLQYIFFGFILAAPYTYLSGGGIVCLIVGTVFLPVVMFLFEVGRNFRYGLLTVGLIVFSPILLNGFATILQAVGSESAMIVSEWRFHPLWIAPVLYLVHDAVSYIGSCFEERQYRAN